METKQKAIAIAVAVLLAVVVFFVGKYIGHRDGYKTGYDKGYAQALETITPAQTPKPDTVQTVATVQTTTTTTVRPKQKNEEASVVIKTTPPKVVASVNGKKYDFKPQSQVLETGVQTSAAINIKVPERRWVAGIGTDGKKAAYMIKAPLRGAVGLWIAGTGRDKVFGGVSVSF